MYTGKSRHLLVRVPSRNRKLNVAFPRTHRLNAGRVKLPTGSDFSCHAKKTWDSHTLLDHLLALGIKLFTSAHFGWQ